MVAALSSTIELRLEAASWNVPVIAAEAINDRGITLLYEQIINHRRWLEETGLLIEHRREQRRNEFMEAVTDRLRKELNKIIQEDKDLKKYVRQVEQAKIAPILAADKVLQTGKLLDSWKRQLDTDHFKSKGRSNT